MNWYRVQKSLQDFFDLPWFEARFVQAQRKRCARPVGKGISQSTPRRLFVDVSVISRHDAGTGIQRVVRGVMNGLVNLNLSGWEVHPVSATRKRPYAIVHWPSAESNTVGTATRTPLAAKPGDVFLGLDFALDTVRQHHPQLRDLKKQGLNFWFVMYDLLPVQRSEWFSDQLVVRYRQWMRAIAILADGFLGISPPVLKDLAKHLEMRYGLKKGRDVFLELMPMGADIKNAAQPTSSAPSAVGTEFQNLITRLENEPTALMVGTLEPRKAHADVLAAFELLWQEGSSANLVLIGRAGWKTEALQQRILSHPEHGKRLIWLNNATDIDLQFVYAASKGVVIASYAEGFGLPLLEALGHGKPVLARDLPVFHTVQSDSIQYFPAQATPSILADALKVWLQSGFSEEKVMATPVVPTWEMVSQSVIQRFAWSH